MRKLLFLTLVLVACNPVKRVLKDPGKTLQVVDHWLQENPQIPDTAINASEWKTSSDTIFWDDKVIDWTDWLRKDSSINGRRMAAEGTYIGSTFDPTLREGIITRTPESFYIDKSGMIRAIGDSILYRPPKLAKTITNTRERTITITVRDNALIMRAQAEAAKMKPLLEDMTLQRDRKDLERKTWRLRFWGLAGVLVLCGALFTLFKIYFRR